MRAGVNTWILFIRPQLGNLTTEASLDHEAAAGIGTRITDWSLVMISGRARCDIAGDGSIGWLADDPGAPDGISAAVVADKIALLVNRRATGGVAADIHAVFVTGFRLWGGGKKGQSGDGEGGDGGDGGFHDRE